MIIVHLGCDINIMLKHMDEKPSNIRGYTIYVEMFFLFGLLIG